MAPITKLSAALVLAAGWVMSSESFMTGSPLSSNRSPFFKTSSRRASRSLSTATGPLHMSRRGGGGTDDMFWWSKFGPGGGGNNRDEDESDNSRDKHGRGRRRGTSTFDFEELRYRMARNRILGPGLDPKTPTKALPEEVHIILFYPDTDNEGVHTIEFPKGSGNNVILAFESKSECRRFTRLLKAQQFFDPSPRDINLKSLNTYCKTLGVQVQFVPKGTHLVPPSSTVDELNHDPYLKEAQSSLDRLFYERSEGDLYEDERLYEQGVLEEGYGCWE